MGKPIRAGGHVLRESGWELESPPRPANPVCIRCGQTIDLNVTAFWVGPDAPRHGTCPGDAGPETEVDPLLLEPEHEPISLEPAETVDFAADRAECPNCGKNVAVRKDGNLRKHQCIEGDG